MTKMITERLMVEVVVMKILIKMTMKTKDIMRTKAVTKVRKMTTKGMVKVTVLTMKVIIKVAVKTMLTAMGPVMTTMTQAALVELLLEMPATTATVTQVLVKSTVTMRRACQALRWVLCTNDLNTRPSQQSCEAAALIALLCS